MGIMTAASTGWLQDAGVSVMALASTLVPGMMESLETLMLLAVSLERVVMEVKWVMEEISALGDAADVVGVVEEIVVASLEEGMEVDFSEEEMVEVEMVEVEEDVGEVAVGVADVGVAVVVEAELRNMWKSYSCLICIYVFF